MAVSYPYYMPQQPMGYQQPIMPRPQYVEQQPQIGIKGRPVSSLDEVRATSIDFDGSIFYFPDIANKKIYTKQINLDGTSTLNVYELKNIPAEPVVNLEQYVTREEFETALTQMKESLSRQREIEEQQKKKEASIMNF